MTGDEFKAIRKRAGLTLRDLGATLGYSDVRGFRRIEDGEREPVPALALLMELIDAGEFPEHRYRTAPERDDG